MSTPVAKPQTVVEQWYVVDATDQVLGRLATRIATVLRGKDTPQFTAHVTGRTHVVVTNGRRIRVTGNKLAAKTYYRHTSRPGSLRQRTLAEELTRDTTQPLQRAV